MTMPPSDGDDFNFTEDSGLLEELVRSFFSKRYFSSKVNIPVLIELNCSGTANKAKSHKRVFSPLASAW